MKNAYEMVWSSKSQNAPASRGHVAISSNKHFDPIWPRPNWHESEPPPPPPPPPPLVTPLVRGSCDQAAGFCRGWKIFSPPVVAELFTGTQLMAQKLSEKTAYNLRRHRGYTPSWTAWCDPRTARRLMEKRKTHRHRGRPGTSHRRRGRALWRIRHRWLIRVRI